MRNFGLVNFFVLFDERCLRSSKKIVEDLLESVFVFQDALKRLCIVYQFLKMASSVISFDIFNAFSPGYF
jgi:hypothetical protein